jgi:hypothetical protein
LQVLLLLLEAVVALVLIRRWSFVRKSYLGAIGDAFGDWDAIVRGRQEVSEFRRRGDLAMLRFLKLRMNRWDELMQTVRMGIPKVAGR